MKLQVLKPAALSKGLIVGKNMLIKQTPIVLTIGAVGGVVATMFMMHKATTTAIQLIEKRKAELNLAVDEKLTIEETVKTCWKVYIPPLVSAGLTIGAIIASSAINEKRKAALASLYAISEATLKQYQDKIEQVAGPDVAKTIKDVVNGESIGCDETSVMLHDPDITARVLVHDKMTGQDFWSSITDIREAANDINQMIHGGDMMASLNDFIGFLIGRGATGLSECSFGDECGWNLTTACKPYCTAALSSKGTPYVVLDWNNNCRPHYEYRDI